MIREGAPIILCFFRIFDIFFPAPSQRSFVALLNHTVSSTSCFADHLLN